MDAELKAYLDGMVETIVDRLGTRIDVLERRIGALEERVGALEERVGALEERVGALEGRVGALEVRFGALEVRFGGLEERVGSVERQLETLRQEVRDGFIAVDERFRTAEQGVAQFEARVEARLNQTDAQLQTVQVALTGLAGTTQAGLTGLADSMHAELTGLAGTTQAGLAGLADTVQVELTGVKEAMRQVVQRVDRLEQHAVATNARIDDLHADMRQRFRLLNERVGGIEEGLAA
jgi:chromosome segregation ATPase